MVLLVVMVGMALAAQTGIASAKSHKPGDFTPRSQTDVATALNAAGVPVCATVFDPGGDSLLGADGYWDIEFAGDESPSDPVLAPDQRGCDTIRATNGDHYAGTA